jgi:hypothetical protein
MPELQTFSALRDSVVSNGDGEDFNQELENK